jgi:hypothetical protein
MLRDTGFDINRSNRGKILRIGISTIHHLHFIDECSSLILSIVTNSKQPSLEIITRPNNSIIP